MKNCIIFDVDGTIADNSHRLHHIKVKPKNWKAYEAGTSEDSPIDEVLWLLRSLHVAGWTIVLATGRSEISRDVTTSWLTENLAPHEKLYMRKNGDYREDTIVKEEMINQMKQDGYNPVMAFDDRPRLLRMYRSHGIKTFDVGNGEEF